LGFWFYEKTKIKLFSSKLGIKIYQFGHKYGYVTLLLSWLPIVGDPLTLTAGMFRLKFLYFIVIAGALRVLRYYFLTLMV